MSRGLSVWYNGKVVPTNEAKISLFTHGLHYGTGAFEGIRCYKQLKGGGGIFRLQDHIVRLFESFKILGFSLPYTVEQLTQACVDTVLANGFEECYIRPFAFIGDGPLGVATGDNPPIDVAVLVWEWNSYVVGKNVNDGARYKISSFVRPHINASMTKGKITGQYVNSVFAKREASVLGYDGALLLDSEGFLTEGSGENLFIVKKGKLKTTSLTAVLDGITRDTVMELLSHKKLVVEETRFSRDELYCADEVFLTGTAAEVIPVCEVDSRLIGKGPMAGKPGPITLELQKEYQAMVRGQVPAFAKNWIFPVKA